MNNKFFFDSDNDGHWYVVPLDLRKKFMKLLDKMDRHEYDVIPDVYDEFEDTFDEYRLNMHISNYSFENLEEIK